MAAMAEGTAAIDAVIAFASEEDVLMWFGYTEEWETWLK